MSLSILKQIFGVFVVLLLVGGAYFAYEHLGETHAEVVSADPAADAAPVRLAAARVSPVSRRVEAVGSTMANLAIRIVPPASGRIRAIEFRPGERVSKGDILVLLDDEIERADFAQAEAELKQARLALERAHTLRQSNTLAQATLEELIAQQAVAEAARDRAEARLADRAIRAPFDGIVGLRQVDIGAFVDDTTVITTLDDLSEVEIEFSLPETLYGKVHPGMPVEATSAAFPDRVFKGEIAIIDSRIDPVARAFKLRARLPNPDLALPAGMFMLLSVILDDREAVTVPEQALVPQADDTFVFVVENGIARRRAVTTGQRQVGRVEIVEGLAAGEQVVQEGVQRLRDETEVRVVDTASGEEEPPPAEADPA